ncbi:MAG TPA: Maf family protein [Solirubrobacteraceae bacterium]|nr:Maf family protein [Solirubrobacteraceae bacterium]
MILASRSPQRRALLEQLGIEFELRPADVRERGDGEPQAVVRENAQRKARAVAATLAADDDRLVLGVDTVVALAGRVLGKPTDEAEARAFLKALAGRVHAVRSGICLCGPGRERSAVATTSVRFRALGPSEIHWYVATGEWRERAGGYAIQGRGAALVSSIQGDYFNVVGLPVASLLRLAPELLG